MNAIVVNATQTAEIIKMWGRKAVLNRLRKNTSLAVLPIIIVEIKQKK